VLFIIIFGTLSFPVLELIKGAVSRQARRGKGRQGRDKRGERESALSYDQFLDPSLACGTALRCMIKSC